MGLQLTPLAERFGIEATGVDLRSLDDAEAIARLNRAFADHGVLVVRDQALTPHDMVRAVELFGRIFEQQDKRFALEDCPLIHYVSNRDRFPDGTRYIPGSGFHTDHSNFERPPMATVLFAVNLPDVGGDTQYVDMCGAYDDLPAQTKARIDGLTAVHVYQSRHSARKLMVLAKDNPREVPKAVRHPLVRTHPVTGRKALFVNPIRIEAIEGLADEEALGLLDELLTYATQEKYQYRHKWRPGDMVMWDNRRLLHKANGDYPDDQDRYLYRVMLEGERPV
ncbi:MAG: TauD/TfdA family dioxygenase [Rhodospirillaceae bacterium]